MARRDWLGRDELVARAAQTREALIAVHEAAPPEMARTSLSSEQLEAWTSVQKRARPLAEQFQATVRGLRRDRFARRMAYWWFEASSMRWWRRTPEAGQAEAAAWTYLQQLPTGTCPRSAPREIRDDLDTVLNDWDEKHAGDIAALTGLSRGMKRQQRK